MALITTLALVESTTFLRASSQGYSLPEGQVGQFYQQNLEAVLQTHGLRLESDSTSFSFQWSLAEGTNLPGLELRPDGTLFGIPEKSGNSWLQFQVVVRDLSLPQAQGLTIPFSVHLKSAAIRLVPTQAIRLEEIAPQESRQEAEHDPVDKPLAQLPDSGSFDPAKYIRIIEDTGKRKIVLYSPRQNLRYRQMRADAESTLIVEIDDEILKEGSSVPLNRLFMSAELIRDDKRTPVEVIGYSEVGKDQEKASSQNAVAFRTVDEIESLLVNIYRSTRAILYALYGTDCTEKLRDGIHLDCARQKELELVASLDSDPGKTSVLRMYQAEADSFKDFFTDDNNLAIANLIGAQVFRVEPGTLRAVAEQLSQNLKALSDTEKVTPEARKEALRVVLTRIKGIWADFQHMREYSANGGKRRELKKFMVQKLLSLLTSGTIDLPNYDAKDGDALILTVEAKEPGGNGIGAKARFRFALKNLAAKVSISPSLFFIKRLGLSAEDTLSTNPIAVSPVDYSPFPGTTFGVTFFHRRLKALPASDGFQEFKPTGGLWDRFRSALAPGIGVNVTFMNFKDPRDFNPTGGADQKGQFDTTNGTNFQIGAGIVGSLFGQRLQFTYGLNLNAERKKRYFGVGFGFLEVGKSLAGFLKK